MLTIIYTMLRHGTSHEDLDADHFVTRNRLQIARRTQRRLHGLGYTVTLVATTAEGTS